MHLSDWSDLHCTYKYNSSGGCYGDILLTRSYSSGDDTITVVFVNDMRPCDYVTHCFTRSFSPLLCIWEKKKLTTNGYMEL